MPKVKAYSHAYVLHTSRRMPIVHDKIQTFAAPNYYAYPNLSYIFVF